MSESEKSLSQEYVDEHPRVETGPLPVRPEDPKLPPWARLVLRAVLILGIVTVGVLIFISLVVTAPETPKVPRTELPTLVETEVVRAATQRARVTAQGTVTPARQVVVIPEVSGRVRWQHAELVPGGRIKKGETLVRLDGSVYALQAAQQKAMREQAQLQVQIEQSRKAVAENEWQVIGDPSATPEGKAVALREPQLKSAKAGVHAAKSAERLAKVNLGRTVLRAPFNAIVQSENVDLGQLVGPSSQLATLVGTDTYWVQVSIPVDMLTSLKIPGVNAAQGEGSAATIRQEIGAETVTRQGRVIRLLGDLEPVGRMARVLVEVDDPLGSAAGAEEKGKAAPESAIVASSRLPMLLGSYVSVELQGAELKNVVRVPRTAVRENNEVYVYAKDRLAVRKVNVAWRQRDWVLVDSGVQDGDEVIVSRVPGAVNGMLLEKPGKKRAAPDPKAPAPDEKEVLGQR